MGSNHEDVYVLDTVTREDIPHLYTLWSLAFASNRVHQLSFPIDKIDPQALESWYYNRMVKLLDKPELRNYKITDTRTGQLVACARWGFPHDRDAAKKDAEKDKIDVEIQTDENKDGAEPMAKEVGLVGMNERLFDDVGDVLNRWREEYVKWEDTYSMSIFALTHG